MFLDIGVIALVESDLVGAGEAMGVKEVVRDPCLRRRGGDTDADDDDEEEESELPEEEPEGDEEVERRRCLFLLCDDRSRGGVRWWCPDLCLCDRSRRSRWLSLSRLLRWEEEGLDRSREGPCGLLARLDVCLEETGE